MTAVQLFSALRQLIVLAGCFIVTMAAATMAVPNTPLNLLGADPQDVIYYKSGPVIWCRDRSNSFSVDRLNDDFCDCPDATDEPGTSACPNGRFFCKNQKQPPLWVFSSRVNDGICDCCDGSDEYDGRVRCKPTCVGGVGDAAIQTLPKDGTAEGKGGISEAATVASSWKSRTRAFSWNKETDSGAPKPKYFQVLALLEIMLVMAALWQFYTWSCRRAARARRVFPR